MDHFESPSLKKNEMKNIHIWLLGRDDVERWKSGFYLEQHCFYNVFHSHTGEGLTANTFYAQIPSQIRQNYYLEKPGHLKYKNSNLKASLLKRKTIASSQGSVLYLRSVNWQEMKQASIIVLRVFCSNFDHTCLARDFCVSVYIKQWFYRHLQD